MRRIFCLVLFCLSLTACQVAQLTTLYNDKTSIEEDGLRVDAEHKPITGVYQKYNDKMRLLEESHYVDGKLDGIYTAYGKKGKPILIAQNAYTRNHSR